MESCWAEVVSIGDNRMRNFLQSCGQSLLSLAHQLPEKVPRGVSMRPWSLFAACGRHRFG